jgi:hypothetical protein
MSVSGVPPSDLPDTNETSDADELSEINVSEVNSPEKNATEENDVKKSGDFTVLPDELVLDDILIPLGLNSVSSLISLSKTNRRFKRIIEDSHLWRTLVQHYFPYLQSETPADFNNNARNMFINEYMRYQTLDAFRETNLGMEAILAGLAGLNLDQIPNDNNRITLYKMSLANGRYLYWDKLDPLQRKCAFNLAAENGHLGAMNWFLLKRGDQFSGAQRGVALRYADQFHHPAMVQLILDLSNSADVIEGFIEQLKTEVKHVSAPTAEQILQWAHNNNHNAIIATYENYLEVTGNRVERHITVVR